MRSWSWAVLAGGLLASGVASAQAAVGPGDLLPRGESDFDPRGVPGGAFSTNTGVSRDDSVGSPNLDDAGGGARIEPVRPEVRGMDAPMATRIEGPARGPRKLPDRTPDNFYPLPPLR